MTTSEERQRPPRLTIKPNPSKPPARVVLRSKTQTPGGSKTGGSSSASAAKPSPGKSSFISRQGNGNSSASRGGSIERYLPQTKVLNGSLSSTGSPSNTTSTIATVSAAPARASFKTSQTLMNKPSISALRALRTTTVQRPPWGSSTVANRPTRASKTSTVPNKDDSCPNSAPEGPAAAVSSYDDLDIDTKVRSLINKNESNLNSDDSAVKSIKSPKSVRWDPAVIFCSPPVVTRAPAPETSPSPDDFEDCLKTVFSWRKGDRRKLQLLLDTLKRIDDEEQTPVVAKHEAVEDQHNLERLFQGNNVGGKGTIKRANGSKSDEQSVSVHPKPTLRNTRSEGEQLSLDQMQSNQDRLFERMKFLQDQKSSLDDQMQEDKDMWFGQNMIQAHSSPVATEKLPKKDDNTLPSICGPRSETESPTTVSSIKAPKDGFQNYRRTLKYSGCSEAPEDFTTTAKPDPPSFSPSDENRRYLNMLKKIGIVTSPQECSDADDVPNVVRKNVIPRKPLPNFNRRRLNPRARSFNLSSSSSSDWEAHTSLYPASASSDWTSYISCPTPESSIEQESASSLPWHQIDSLGQSSSHSSSARRANTVSDPFPELISRNVSITCSSKRRDTVSDPSPLCDQDRATDTANISDDSEGGQVIAGQPKNSKRQQKEYTHRWIAFLEKSTSASKDVGDDPTKNRTVPDNCNHQPTSTFLTRELAEYVEHIPFKEELIQPRDFEPDSNKRFTIVTRRRRKQSPVQRRGNLNRKEHVDPAQREVNETIRRFSEIMQIPDGIPRRRRLDPEPQPWRALARRTLEPPGCQLISAAMGRKKNQDPSDKAIAKLNRIPVDLFKNSVSEGNPLNDLEERQPPSQELLTKLKRNRFYLSDITQISDISISRPQLSCTQGKETKSAASQSKLRVGEFQHFVSGLAVNSVPQQKPITPQIVAETGRPIWINTTQQFQQLNREAATSQIMPEAREPIWINSSQLAHQPAEPSPVYLQHSVPVTIPFAPYTSHNSMTPLEFPVDPNISSFPWAADFAPEAYYVNLHSNAVVETAPSGGKSQREARQMHPDWANQILNSFQSKYPKTGTPVPRPPMIKAPRRPRRNPDNKHAAVIQQRLEFLILQKKEEEAMKKLTDGEVPGGPDGKRKKRFEGSADSATTTIITKVPYYERFFDHGIF